MTSHFDVVQGERLLHNVSTAIKYLFKYVVTKKSINGSTDPIVVDNSVIYVHYLIEALDSIFSNGLILQRSGYWPIVYQISHSVVLKELLSALNISTDIGRARAWIYHALNDNLLECYLRHLSAKNFSLQKFYYKNAFLRDETRSTTLQTLVSGMETIRFRLPIDVTYLDLGCWPPSLMKMNEKLQRDTGVNMITDDNIRYCKIVDESGRPVSMNSINNTDSIGMPDIDQIRISPVEMDAPHIITSTTISPKRSFGSSIIISNENEDYPANDIMDDGKSKEIVKETNESKSTSNDEEVNVINESFRTDSSSDDRTSNVMIEENKSLSTPEFIDENELEETAENPFELSTETLSSSQNIGQKINVKDNQTLNQDTVEYNEKEMLSDLTSSSEEFEDMETVGEKISDEYQIINSDLFNMNNKSYENIMDFTNRLTAENQLQLTFLPNITNGNRSQRITRLLIVYYQYNNNLEEHFLILTNLSLLLYHINYRPTPNDERKRRNQKKREEIVKLMLTDIKLKNLYEKSLSVCEIQKQKKRFDIKKCELVKEIRLNQIGGIDRCLNNNQINIIVDENDSIRISTCNEYYTEYVGMMLKEMIEPFLISKELENKMQNQSVLHAKNDVDKNEEFVHSLCKLIDCDVEERSKINLSTFNFIKYLKIPMNTLDCYTSNKTLKENSNLFSLNFFPSENENNSKNLKCRLFILNTRKTSDIGSLSSGNQPLHMSPSFLMQCKKNWMNCRIRLLDTNCFIEIIQNNKKIGEDKTILSSLFSSSSTSTPLTSPSSASANAPSYCLIDIKNGEQLDRIRRIEKTDLKRIQQMSHKEKLSSDYILELIISIPFQKSLEEIRFKRAVLFISFSDEDECDRWLQAFRINDSIQLSKWTTNHLRGIFLTTTTINICEYSSTNCDHRTIVEQLPLEDITSIWYNKEMSIKSNFIENHSSDGECDENLLEILSTLSPSEMLMLDEDEMK
ncbi:hypothetical protein SNEBB_001517 [Seison nebaliae]|nr:hypothetical protein SNEBB_001517 [Seison nebaliae]